MLVNKAYKTESVALKQGTMIFFKPRTEQVEVTNINLLPIFEKVKQKNGL